MCDVAAAGASSSYDDERATRAEIGERSNAALARVGAWCLGRAGPGAAGPGFGCPSALGAGTVACIVDRVPVRGRAGSIGGISPRLEPPAQQQAAEAGIKKDPKPPLGFRQHAWGSIRGH